MDYVSSQPSNISVVIADIPCFVIYFQELTDDNKQYATVAETDVSNHRVIKCTGSS